MDLFATEHVCRIRGGSRPHLMRCSDNEYYIVKFQNNPQGTRTLANDLFGTLLAKRLGLPVAEVAVVNVSQGLISLTDNLTFDYERHRTPCQPGRSFGSRYIFAEPHDKGAIPEDHEIFLGADKLTKVTNQSDFLGALVFDIWTCNRDTRQFVFVRNPLNGRQTAVMIDQGWCFDGGSWCFSGEPTRAFLGRSAHYESATGIDAFESWLYRLENEIDATVLAQVASQIPLEWYEEDPMALRRLVNILDHRRSRTRGLLRAIWENSSWAFPNWPKHKSTHERAQYQKIAADTKKSN
jgi:hypothetical protein